MIKLTDEQRAAIEVGGKAIVSASAGSGKTFVMIEKLVAAIANGVDLDNVLAVTFTKKAAAQMKEKLRSAVIARMAEADGETRTRLKVQLSKISGANISTIHAFCARLLRTYFYCAGIDGTFDIISADDAQAKEFKRRALDNLFEKYYTEENEHFLRLLACYRKKRSDNSLRALILEGYEKLRISARYITLLDGVSELYTEQGFARVCAEYSAHINEKLETLKSAVITFAQGFVNSKKQVYDKIFAEMLSALDGAAKGGIFAPLPALNVTKKPVDAACDKEAGAEFKAFKDALSKSYKAVRGDTADEATERQSFFESGKTAVAFARILKDFDTEYTQIKREENKLDYNDLEHLTLEILSDARVKEEINQHFTCVFVDEYQDVNTVKEEIISSVGGENVFLVGDVKQAIYGFRGSRSLFFAEKYNSFEGGGGTALRLSSNFRSADGVIDFVNKLFSDIMTVESCGFDYSKGSKMQRGGGYPENSGSAQIHVFGKDEEEEIEREVYSVKASAKSAKHTREGLAVLKIVEKELQSTHFDLKTGEEVDTQAGDICILTRKRQSAEVAGIVRALTDAGYSVAGANEQNICTRPEVKEMLDILSYIDNSKQDIPLVTALLSPLGGLTCDELAAIRIAFKGEKSPFRDCCKKYINLRNATSRKLESFYARAEKLRSLAEILTAAEIIDKISEDAGFEASYYANGGEKLKNIRRLAKEAEGLSVAAFLNKLKESDYEISAAGAASSDSIKIMTMHASKGLEFPVVIIADICATFKGREYSEMPFDDNFGFAPKCHDIKSKLTKQTVLRRLATSKSDKEELKNELNLFYVACTRAMCRLHILAEDIKPYNRIEAAEAKCYAKLFDISAYQNSPVEPKEEFTSGRKVSAVLTQPDKELKELISTRFMRGYAHADSVNLPVKSSASAILKRNMEEPFYRPHELFKDDGEGETGTERGTAYHAFLEHCDFNIKDRQGVEKQIEKMLASRKITEQQKELLNVDELCEILSMPVFKNLNGATLYKEQEFLCRLPADEILGVSAKDSILVQGAIDLLAVSGNGATVIDYKYSHKDDNELIQTYYKQLALYKKAVALVLNIDEKNIGTVIINIKRRRQISLEV